MKYDLVAESQEDLNDWIKKIDSARLEICPYHTVILVLQNNNMKL